MNEKKAIRSAVGTGAPRPRPPLVNTFRPEIQALRALAVLVVVLYHLWPQVLTGGFVGVDVFFVVSGYLITGHLVREQGRTGRIALGEFWARRARRLLPASLLVLFVSAALVLLFVPQIFWAQFFRETIASSLYVENWLLSSDAVNYLATNNVATAAQHYWSLSVEEQFYIVWPLLMVAAGVAAVRLGRKNRHTILVGVLGTVTALSFAYSVYLTATDPASAYFVTPVRAWEFGAGGLLAMFMKDEAIGFGPLRSLVAWLSWAALVATAVLFSAGTPFPGSAALLPVAATVGVIWAGAPTRVFAPTRLIGTRPVQWLGGVSYSTYLWHSPLIVVAPYVLGYAQLAIVQKSAILLITLVLAWLTKRFVEDPVRTGPLLAPRRARVTLVAALAAIVIVVAPSILGTVIVDTRVAQQNSIRQTLAADSCFGAPTLLTPSACSTARFPVISPDPALAPQDSPHIYFTQPPCFASTSAAHACQLGDPSGTTRVALIGDSHAAQWEPALAILARKHHWNLTVYLKTNCAFTDAKRTPQYASCSAWTKNVSRALARQKPFDVVIASFFADNLNLELSAGSVTASGAVAGFRNVWAPLTKSGSTVVILRDTPHMTQNTTVCVALHGSSGRCDVGSTSARSTDDPEYDAAKSLAGVRRLDLGNYFCDTKKCFAVIGGVAVHTDPYHMTQTYSKTTAPFLDRALASVTTVK